MSTPTPDLDQRPARPSKRQLPYWLELPLLLTAALLIALVLKTFVVQVFFIPSGSMEDTLQIDDRVAVNRFEYRIGEPERGDVIVFDGIGSFVPADQAPSESLSEQIVAEIGRTVGLVPPPDTVFVKRVIGVAGDRVACCDADGLITVNGDPIDESGYLYPGDVPSLTPFDVIVPAGHLWVMGDHRSASADSRAHLGEPGGGFVPVDRVLGRASWVIWPVAHWGQVTPGPPS